MNSKNDDAPIIIDNRKHQILEFVLSSWPDVRWVEMFDRYICGSREYIPYFSH